MYDLTQSPFGAVVAFGIVQALGGTCLCLIPVVQAFQKKRKESRQKEVLASEKSHVSKLKERDKRSLQDVDTF